MGEVPLEGNAIGGIWDAVLLNMDILPVGKLSVTLNTYFVKWSFIRTGLLLQGYLAHQKQPPPPGTPYDPRHSHSIGS